MDETINKSRYVRIFIINLLIEFVLSVIMLFVLALLLSNTDLEESIISPAIIGISSFTIMLGGLVVSSKIKSKGIVIGAIQGFIYMFILYLLSSFANMDFSLTLESLTMIGVGIFCGAIGGIVGVNIK